MDGRAYPARSGSDLPDDFAARLALGSAGLGMGLAVVAFCVAGIAVSAEENGVVG